MKVQLSLLAMEWIWHPIQKNEFVLFLDDDNLLEEGAVQRAINIASQESECKSVFFY